MPGWRPRWACAPLLGAAVLGAPGVEAGPAADAQGQPAAGAPAAPGLLDRVRDDVAQFLAYPHFERGYRMLRDSNLAEAEREFELGLAKDPREHRARLARADVLQQLGRLADAHRELDVLDAQGQMGLATLRRRLAWHRADRPVSDAALAALIDHPQAGSDERQQARRLRDERAAAGPRSPAPAEHAAHRTAEVEHARLGGRSLAPRVHHKDRPARAARALARALRLRAAKAAVERAAGNGRRMTAASAAQSVAASVTAQRHLIDTRLARGDTAGAAQAWRELAAWPGLPATELADAHAQRAELLRSAGDVDAAIAAYQDAQASGAATAPMRAELAQLLLDRARPAEALVVLRAAQAFEPSPALAARILRTRFSLGGTEDMERDEEAVLAALPALGEGERVEMLELIANRRARSGRPDDALAALEPGALPAAADPRIRSLRAQLLAQRAYARFAARRDDDAAKDFARALGDDAGQWPWRRARAYALTRAGRSAEAGAELEQAIDQVVATAPADNADLWQLREQNRLLRRGLSFSAYESVRRAAAGGTANPASATGAVPSQGGIELLWQPEAFDPGPDRVLQLTGRMFWSHRGSSLAPDADSVQASVGLRYKPAAAWPVYVELQRLQRLGSNSSNDWLVRSSAGWAEGPFTGGAAQPGRTNYASIYADAGHYLRAGHSVLYVEARQGLSWRLAGNWAVSPHVVVDGRAERPDPGRVSYAEWGLGVAVQHRFGATRYETEGRSAELLLHYKRGIERTGSGWVLTFVLGL